MPLWQLVVISITIERIVYGVRSVTSSLTHSAVQWAIDKMALNTVGYLINIHPHKFKKTKTLTVSYSDNLHETLFLFANYDPPVSNYDWVFKVLRFLCVCELNACLRVRFDWHRKRFIDIGQTVEPFTRILSV